MKNVNFHFLYYLLFCWFLSNINAEAQTLSQFNRFADLHIHTDFKHFYRNLNRVELIYDHKNDPSYIKSYFGGINWGYYNRTPKRRLKGLTSHVKTYDQSNFNNLSGLSGSILCTALFAYEKQFALNGFKRLLSHCFVSHISFGRLRNVGSRNNYPFKELFSEYLFLINQSINPPPGLGLSQIEVAQDHNDLLRIISQNHIAQILTVEGGHALYGPLAGAKKQVRLGYASSTAIENEIYDRIDSLRKLPHKVLFITLTHFTDNMIAGFSKTLDRPGVARLLLSTISNSGKVRKSFFTKFGEGIHGDIDLGDFVSCKCPEYKVNVKMPYTNNPHRSNLGMEVICRLLLPDNPATNSKRILIDVKHLDIQARFEYYELLSHDYSENHIPIIASHVAASGESLPIAMATALNPLFDRYKEIKDPHSFYLKQLRDFNYDWLCRTSRLTLADKQKFFIAGEPVPSSFNPFQVKGINSGTAGWFYPWGINLCDEEIAIIYRSKGIIGLNFDERVLGSYMLNYSIYKTEIKSRFYEFVIPLSKFFGLYINFEDYYACEPLLRNIFYIVSKSGIHDSTAWNGVMIGSDFDGLIDPINSCTVADQIPSLHRKLIPYSAIFWQLHKNDLMFANQDLFFGNSISCAQIMDRFFYENGREFILNHF